MKRTPLALGAVALLSSGCFTTRVQSRAVPTGGTYEDRQWFLLNGAIPLSAPVGSQCKAGVASTESTSDLLDMGLQYGLLYAGAALLGGSALACSAPGTPTGTSAVCSAGLALGGLMLPFSFGSRTVRYTCASDGAATVPLPSGPVPVATPPL